MESAGISSANTPAIALDSMCVSYWLDALEHTEEPAPTDALQEQKLALVRLFFYSPPGTLVLVPEVSRQIGGIKDPERLRRHTLWIDIHLHELLGPPPDALTDITAMLSEEGVNPKDTAWLAEAIYLQLPIALTWDRRLLKQAEARTDIDVLSPHDAWEQHHVPRGSSPAIEPVESNPLSRVTWWRL